MLRCSRCSVNSIISIISCVSNKFYYLIGWKLTNEKIAEILIDPSEERIVIKCLKSYCKIALYEPNMKKLYIFTEYVSTIKWSEYEINYINEEIKSRIINTTYCFL